MIWKVVSPCIEESRFLLWSWWGLCKKKRCPFDHLNKKAFDWSNSGIMTRRNLKKSLRPKIMHHLDETLVSSINSQHILDCKWKPIISVFERFFSKSYSNWLITKGWKTSDNLFLNTVNRADSRIIYDNLVRMVKKSTSLGRFPGIDLWHFLATSFRTGGISSLAPLNKRVTR